MNAPSWHAIAAFCLLALCNCQVDDTGKACGNSNDTLIAQTTIVGENPTVEIVRLDRDAKCESFQCVTHKGLDPYCTRTCTYNKAPASAKTCQADSDCTASTHCNAGICNDDDCPAGYWCRAVQDVGPLKGQQFCVRRDNCQDNFDCDDVGKMQCAKLGCFDACLKNADSCPLHQLTCSNTSDLGCQCGDGKSSGCPDEVLVCKPPDAAQAFPAGSVKQVGVCMPK